MSVKPSPELFDVLAPPLFEKTGVVKTLGQVLADHDWIGTFNLWIVQSVPQPAIVYQQRSPEASWAPLKLDVAAGGHFQAGEELKDGMREVREELGKDYRFEDVNLLGRRLNVGVDIKGRLRQTVVSLALIEDNSPIESYVLQETEVFAICTLPLADLLRVHVEPDYSFEIEGLTSQGVKIRIPVTSDSFPPNWDNYHYKMALLVQRYLAGEKALLY